MWFLRNAIQAASGYEISRFEICRFEITSVAAWASPMHACRLVVGPDF